MADPKWCVLYSDGELRAEYADPNLPTVIAIHPDEASARKGRQAALEMFCATQPARERIRKWTRDEIAKVLEGAEEQQALLLKGVFDMARRCK